MTNLRFAAIIVIYNKTIENSITCNSIKKIKKNLIDIFIVDNSDKDFGNSEICRKNGYIYLSMSGNKGLSMAYNRAIENLTNQDVIILLDDDTEVTQKYFDVLDKCLLDNENADIFAPVVYGQDGVIYSPNRFNFLRNKFILNPSEHIEQKDFNAIASCLAIRRRVFENYRFNEELFVDQVDQYFCYEQRCLNRRFVKMDVSIQQNFYQRGEKLDAESGWNRMQLRLTDIMKHASLMGNFKYKILGTIKCYGLSVQIAMKCKSLKVLFRGIRRSTSLIFK